MAYTQVVALTDFTAGTTIVSADVDSNFSAIRDVVNALITGTNTINAARINPSSGAGIGVNTGALDYVGIQVGGGFTSGGAGTAAVGVSVSYAMTAATGDTDYVAQAYVAGTITTQGSAETIAAVVGLRVDEPTITKGSGDTITTAVSVWITGAPTEGTNNYALWVDAGDTRLDGGLLMTGAVGVDVNPGSDIDADLITVGVSGTPRLWWDESESAFTFTTGPAGAVTYGFNNSGIKKNTGSFDLDSGSSSATRLLVNGGLCLHVDGSNVVCAYPIIIPTGTPASAGAAGTTGTIEWDSDYVYVCTATNTWKRAAIATW